MIANWKFNLTSRLTCKLNIRHIGAELKFKTKINTESIIKKMLLPTGIEKKIFFLNLIFNLLHSTSFFFEKDWLFQNRFDNHN